MTTDIYQFGNRAAALAATKTALAAFVKVGTDGAKYIDRPAMQSYLQAQFIALSADGAAPAPATTASVDAAARTVNTQNYCDNLDAKFAALRTRSDWPAAGSTSTGSVANSVRTAKADAKAASLDVTRYYGWLADISSSTFQKSVATFLDAAQPYAAVAKGVVRTLDDRFYIVTYVTDRDEESAPSQVSNYLQPDQNDTVTITVGPPGGRPDIVGWRLYRSNSGSATAAFQLVEDKLASNAVLDAQGNFRFFNLTGPTYTDSRTASQLLETCPTLTWNTPPATLRGLVGMPNGVMAGFFNNSVCFSESFVPYAWPVEYQITTEFPIVGLGVFGQTLVVCHQGGVDYISGADAASMSAQKSVSLQACAAARSIVSSEGGVIFASPDGLCLANGNGVQIITQDHFKREDWQKLTPSSMIGAFHEGTYYLLQTTAAVQTCYAMHLPTGRLTTLDAVGSTFYVDKLTDRVYTVQGTSITALFAGATYRTATWKSRITLLPSPAGFAWLQVQGEFEAPVTVKWYGNNQLIYTVVVTSREPVRLPDGRFLEHTIEVSSAARWSAITLASSTDELKRA